MQRISFIELQSTISAVLQRAGVSPQRADRCATLFAETTRDGVYTHGLNRLPRMLAMIENGSVSPTAEPSVVASHGALESWDGHLGIGNLNAEAAMARAIELADQYSLGCVALRNTSHWMRGGTYGWQAADRGYFALSWTNTNPNTPAWGTAGATLGNNPFVVAIPRMNPETGKYKGGPHVVLDMAISQFSYGQLDAHIARGEQLSVPGGFDTEGNLTSDPAAIRASYRALPIGFWKGSGPALTLDLFAAMLSGGKATHEISLDPLFETGISQIFLVVSPSNIAQAEAMTETSDALIQALRSAPRSDPARAARYPGEETLRLRQENNLLGIPVDESVWAEIRQRMS